MHGIGLKNHSPAVHNKLCPESNTLIRGRCAHPPPPLEVGVHIPPPPPRGRCAHPPPPPPPPVLCKHKDEPTSTSAIIKAILTPRARFPYCKLFGCVEDTQGEIPILQTIWVRCRSTSSIFGVELSGLQETLHDGNGRPGNPGPPPPSPPVHQLFPGWRPSQGSRGGRKHLERIMDYMPMTGKGMSISLGLSFDKFNFPGAA